MCKNKQMFENTKDFCPDFPKLAQKVVVRRLPAIFLPRVTSKKGLHLFFCKRLTPLFEVKQFCPDVQEFCQVFRDFAQIFRDFAQIFRDFAKIFRDFSGFSTNQNFCGCVCTPCTPTFTPLDHGDSWQSQLHSYHRQQQKEQVTAPQEQRPTGIRPDTHSLQYLHL